MDLQTQTSNILGSISDTAESICSDKVLFPKEKGDKKKAECILIGLMTCLVAAMGDNPKLAYNILPEYLNKLGEDVPKKDYKKCSKDSMSFYNKFRDIGASVQFSSSDWEDVMAASFADLITKGLEAKESDDGQKTLVLLVQKLVEESKTYSETEVTVVKFVSHKKTLIALAIASVLLFAALTCACVFAYTLISRNRELSASIESLQTQNSELISTVSSQEEVIASLNGQIDDLDLVNSELGTEITEFSNYIEDHESDIQVSEHLESFDAEAEEGSGRFYADSYVVTTSGEEVSINVTMSFYGTCDLQGDNKRITAAWDDHFTDDGTIKVTFTPVKKGATTFHFFNDQNGDTFDVLVIYV